MVDSKGYRPNVGILITNSDNQVLLAKRHNQEAWQLPQGGIDEGEDDLTALYRELYEEVGLRPKDVKILAKTPKWLRYKLPKNRIRYYNKPVCIGQKQVWFLLKLLTSEDEIKLDTHFDIEFDDWQWVDYWHPIEKVVDFKRGVYEDMLKALAPIAFNNEHQIPKCYIRPLKRCATTQI
jgi:putative (di)nucleoside polyphosphate hydrolase